MNEDKASRYHRLNRRATLAWIVIAPTGLIMFLWSGGSRIVRDVAAILAAGDPAAPSTVALYALALVVAYVVLRFPLALYQGFILERKYGLSSETLPVWLRDHLRATGLIGVLSVGASEIIYLSLRWSPGWWWLLSALSFIAATAILTRAAPVLILPLFYTFEPLERESLRARLNALAARAGIPVLGAYVWGLGAKSRRANAALVGSGATRRILLSDTLLDNYSDDEIEVILAHEMAHHVHGDIRTGLVVEALLVTASFGLGAAILETLWTSLDLTGPADVAGLPLLVLAGAAVSAAAAPAINALSRRNERRADNYALRLAGQPEAFVSAMRRLAAQNLAEERPSRLARWLFHTHPTIEERVERARRYRTCS